MQKFTYAVAPTKVHNYGPLYSGGVLIDVCVAGVLISFNSTVPSASIHSLISRPIPHQNRYGNETSIDTLWRTTCVVKSYVPVAPLTVKSVQLSKPMLLSQELVARRAESGEKPHPLTTPTWCSIEATSCPLTIPATESEGRRRQTLAFPSEETVATCELSWEKAQLHTTLLCDKRLVAEAGVAISRRTFWRAALQ